MNEKAQALITLGSNGALTPGNFEGLWRLSEIMAASGMMPKAMDRPETVFVAVQMGLEVGLSPMQAVQNIAVINGRPTIWGDALLGLVRGSGLLQGIIETITGEGDAMAATCTVTRKGEQGDTVGQFSVADAKRAALWGKAGPWTQYPKRMLQMRARGFALRDKFSDVLKGLYAREEIEHEQYMGQVEVLSSAATLREIQAATVRKETATVPQEAVQEPERDSAGVAWDERMHSTSRTRNSDGTWRKRKGASTTDPEPLNLAPSDEPAFADVLRWVQAAQTAEELDEAMDAGKDVEMTPAGREEVQQAAATQLAIIERMQQ